MNIENITEKYCVNKEQPEKHCNGKCHLNKVIKQQSEKKNDPKAPPHPEIKTDNLFIEDLVEYAFNDNFFEEKVKSLPYNLLEGFFIKVFHPPSFS